MYIGKLSVIDGHRSMSWMTEIEDKPVIYAWDLPYKVIPTTSLAVAVAYYLKRRAICVATPLTSLTILSRTPS